MSSIALAPPPRLSEHCEEIAPLEDARWAGLVERHPSSSVFHTREWLEALNRTYGYQAAAYTTSKPGEELTNALAFCRVRSWLTGNRIISLPFSDHCAPLTRNERELKVLLSLLKAHCESIKGYLELRPTSSCSSVDLDFKKSEEFYWHRLDMRRSLDDLFNRFHPTSVRAKINRSSRSNLVYEEGTTESLLQRFYGLMVMTRRRHHLPPQPLLWFRNLIESMKDRLKLRLVSKDGQPAAAILTLRHKGSIMYKYGCSDPRFHRFGAMQCLLWKAIQEAKALGLSELDLGRTEASNLGLLTFKDRWGASRTALTYLRFPSTDLAQGFSGLPIRIAKCAVAITPDPVLIRFGGIVYRHWA